MITYDESIFSANNSCQKIWTLENYRILCPKRKGKDIIVSNFLLLWSRLNLFSLLFQQQKNLTSSGIPLEAVMYFEYGKMEEGYWIGEYLLDQIKIKDLLIGEALYPGYKLLLMFDNATSDIIYTKDSL